MFVDPELKDFFAENDLFETVFAIEGEVFRNVKNRKTMRFAFNGKNYFVKIHRGVGWKEIIKCLSMGKKPVLGAENEFEAIRLLEKLGVPTMKCRAFAKRGSNPARQESFIITDELQNKISLEDFCKDWKTNPPPEKLKHEIIDRLAETCAKMHFSGLNHRDCCNGKSFSLCIGSAPGRDPENHPPSFADQGSGGYFLLIHGCGADKTRRSAIHCRLFKIRQTGFQVVGRCPPYGSQTLPQRVETGSRILSLDRKTVLKHENL